MTWGTPAEGARARSTSPTPSTSARSAGATSTPTCPTWRCPTPTTHSRSWRWPCASWSRTGFPTGLPPGTSGATTASSSPSPRSRTGSRPREKKSGARVERDYLDWALCDFSGYIAVDELYDGPFCVLSIVDNHTFKRLVYEVLEKSPTKKDIEAFLNHFQGLLLRRGKRVLGITTDGSPLYPEPIANVFGPVPHQICEFHVIKEITLALLRAVAKVRKRIKAQLPILPRGRPCGAKARRLARRNARQQQKIADLFDNRHLFVRRELTQKQRQTLHQVTRGIPALRPLREIMEEVYRLFDRRCRMETALQRLARLRRRVRKFKRLGRALQKLFSPTLEKALTFLDESLLPSTSNAVERGNRRHRKMQKSVYRVRTRSNLVGRMALDLLREQRQARRGEVIDTLHGERAEPRAHVQEDRICPEPPRRHRSRRVSKKAA